MCYPMARYALWGMWLTDARLVSVPRGQIRKKDMWMDNTVAARSLFVRLVLMMALGLMLCWETGCSTNPCVVYFQELKRKCQINFGGGTSPEGSKLDEYITKPFSDCQVEICVRASISEIDCSDPETHVPGGRDGRFETCQETLSN